MRTTAAHTTRMCGKLVNYDAYVMSEETLNIICGYVEYPAVRIDLRSNRVLQICVSLASILCNIFNLRTVTTRIFEQL